MAKGLRIIAGEGDYGRTRLSAQHPGTISAANGAADADLVTSRNCENDGSLFTAGNNYQR
jgi:hypothetical protein